MSTEDSKPSVPEEPEASNSQPPPTPQDTDTTNDGAQNQSQIPWQAVFSPQHNAYYFYNTITQETTWVNPLQPDPPTSTSSESADGEGHVPDPSPSTPAATLTALQQAALAQGIDPSLAYLDPSLLSSSNPAAAISASNPSFTAKFNARTGTFTRADARDPTHLSEYERAKRMSEFYFDVSAWEREREQDMSNENGEEGRKRKRPTKKDLVRLFCFLCRMLLFFH